MLSRQASLALPLILFFSAPVRARLIALWPYERLFREAEVIVIASALFSEEAADVSPHTPPLGERFAGVNTTLEVQQVLKGAMKNKTFQLLHFKLVDVVKRAEPTAGVVEVLDGPLLVTFRGARKASGLWPEASPHYLLFLKKRLDGRFEPVSGQYDPQLSVRELSAPGPTPLPESKK